MPFVAIRTDVRDMMIAIARKRAEDQDNHFEMGFEHGFMKCLAMFMPSEAIGLMLCDRDCAMEGDELLTETMPRLVHKP